jgi:putative (di)nucleoside polyphosphate hydrolase
MSLEDLPFRPCVGITLFNKDGHVFVGERIDSKGSWQMPQGGILEDEPIEDAFFREMKEELGNDLAEILLVMEKPLRYELPYHLKGKMWSGKYGGQEQIWVAGRYLGTDDDINIYAHHFPEFESYKWIHIDDVLDTVVPFKKETYKEVVNAFRHLAFDTEK